MLLAIAHNPYTEDPKALWNELRPVPDYLSAEIDRQGLEMLKTVLSKTG